ncbi:uncharacterized protein J4E92_007178 [Alternaria infectoria]|uniref:uncharacterized protein n=1 Tax=Alternaria infectoria TaxID=45303 RepID=UPI00221EBF1A|nr:uncharacterized protein J4E92_007178 [Alternaria infectoria]KAI4925140.1 hypothetical protein J4E92_007178 [Alternaria infectoria]
MATSSGSVFGATLKTITTTKLEELAKQRAVFEEEYAALITDAKAEADPLKRVCLLLDGSKTCLGFQTEKKTKDGRVGRVISGTSRNLRLETDLKNLDRFVEQARFDPSVSNKVLSDWEKTLLRYLSVQSTKYQYADLYGKLVTEWLSSEKSATDDGDVEMGESFEEVPGAKKLASRAAWEKDVFQAAEVDEQALRSYLDELFQANKKDSSAAIRELRKTVENFEANLNYSTPFDPHSLRSTIEGLLNSDLLSNEKREALRDFLDNDVILAELCDILNVRMASLDRWSWGPYVLLEQRRKINGDFSIHFDPDLLQAIFLHYVGVKWSVFFKSAFLDMHKHQAWPRNYTEVPKDDRLRRSYFLGDKGASTQSSVEKKRMSMHHNRYLAHQLLDYPTQRLEAVDGEEEAEYGDYVAKKRRNNGQPDGARMRVQSMSLPARQQSVQQPSGGRTKQTARIASQGAGLFGAAAPNQRAGGGYASAEVDEGIEDDRDSYDRDDEDYRRRSKKPMEAKQGLLHLLSTEIVLNTRLHGELTCFSTTFDSWNPLLPHQTIYTVLDFLGVSDRWKKFFERYLQAPLKFNDDPSAEPRLRCRGMPGSHALSDTLGEAVLFCLDYAANQAAGGPDLYRLGDNVWFWHRDYNTCAKAWASIVKFAEVTGTKLDHKKTGSVRISRDSDAEIDDRLPEGEIRWGFLQLDPKSGQFKIDQKMVDGHVEELRTQLQGKMKSVIDYIQVWNSYAATFFSSNFGTSSNCFGREHVDMMLATHRHIQDSIFPDGSIVQHLKTMIKERFSVGDVPDGFLFFPVELGGLDLKSPFVGLLQIRDSVKENPYDLLDEYEENLHDDYITIKRAFDKGIRHNVRRSFQDANWKPDDPNTFLSFEEFTKYPETFAPMGKANLTEVYKTLLERPKEKPIDESEQVLQALEQLEDRSDNLRGITAHWYTMDAYWKWIAQMYGPDMIGKFGGLNVVDFGLLPIGMVSMFRQRRTKWQG